MSKYLLFLFTHFIGICYVWAQQPAFQSIDQNNGLASNTIYDMLQDSKGYIWIAGDKGLNRFDGVNFTQFKNSNQNSKALSNLVEYMPGEVYTQNFSGQVFRTEGDSLVYEEYLSQGGNYRPLIRIGEQLYSFGMNYLISKNLKTKEYTKVEVENAVFENGTEDGGGIAYFSELGALCRFKQGKIETIQKIPFVNNKFNKIVKCKKGYLVFQKNNNQFIYLLNGTSISQLPGIAENVFVNKICLIEGNIWVCTTNGIYIFDENFNRVNVGEALLSNQNISTIIKDQTGAYWASTLNKGILFIPNINVVKFGNYTPSSLTQKGNSTIIFGTYENEGYEYNIEQNKISNIFKVPFPNQIVSCVYDKEQGLSMFSGNYLRIYQSKKLVFESELAAKSMAKIGTGAYLVGYSNGVTVVVFNQAGYASVPSWLRKGENKEKYFLNTGYKRSRSVAYYAKDSTFIYADVSGVYLHNAIQRLELKYKGKTILGNQLQVHANKLYIASSNCGLLCYNLEDKSMVKLGSEFNLENVNRVKIYGDFIYFSTDNILFKYNPITRQSLQWFCDNGLNNEEIKDFEVLPKHYVVGTSNGLVRFTESEFYSENYKPNVFIQKVMNTETGVVMKPGQLQLKSTENNLDIYFAIPWYKNIQALQVFYKINNGNWVKLAPKQRLLKLASLEPREYSIQLKAVTRSGAVGMSEVLHFTIAPAFYKTMWFMLLLAAVVFSLIFFFFRFRTNQLKHKQKVELEKQELNRKIDLSTLKTLRAQMNPHFIFNSLNSIQSYVYSGEKELASKYLGLFSDLSRSLLDSSNKQEISLHEELELIDLYLQLECIRLPKISYKIEKNDGLQEHSIFIPAMVVQPIVENAIKHGLANKEENCLLHISVTANESHVKIVVDDNGIGRKKAEELNKAKRNKPASFSTDALENRISLLNKNRMKRMVHTITDKFDGGFPSGTLVTLTIPLDYND